jgi:excisionase family DNA binding protein
MPFLAIRHQVREDYKVITPQQRAKHSSNTRNVQTKWLSKSEAAAYLACSERFIERLVSERRLTFHRFGKFVRIAQEDLDTFAEAGRVEAIR